jgi:hypothetical protein
MYMFEMTQHIRLEVVDSDGGSDVELIGLFDTTLGALVGSKDFIFTTNIYKTGDKNIRGELITRIVPIKQSSTDIHIKLGARNLPMVTSCFCMSSINPYIVLDKSFKAGGKVNYITVRKSEVSTSQTPNPSYQAMMFKA